MLINIGKLTEEQASKSAKLIRISGDLNSDVRRLQHRMQLELERCFEGQQYHADN